MWRHRINREAIRRLLVCTRQEASIVPFVGAGLSLPWTSLGWADFLNQLATQTAVAGASSTLPENVLRHLAAGGFEQAAERIDRAAGRAAFNAAIYGTFGDHKLRTPRRRTAMAILPKLGT